jgi:membrane-associated phospholipid phosphatase
MKWNFLWAASKKFKLRLFATAWLLLLLILWLVFINDNFNLDEAVFSVITPHIIQVRTNFFETITFFGNHQFLIPANFILVAYFLIRKKKWKAFTAGVVALSSLGLMSLLKNLIQRIRPPEPLVEGITNFSFPSGHAFMSVAFYGLLIWWTKSCVKNKWQQQIVISFLLLLILLIGFSRVYLRMHYFTDIMAGFCMGTIWLIICISLIENFLQRKQT